MKSRFVSRTVCMMTFGRIKYGWWTSAFQSDAAAIVIGGCGRSGTTLLRAMLNAHKDVVVGPETGVFCGNLNFQDLAHSLQVSERDLRRHYRASRCLGEFIDRVMGVVVAAAGKSRWGEKSPCNVQAIETVFRFFPRARFLHMVRDGRDVVCSLRDHPRYRWENGQRVATGVCNPWSTCVRRWVDDTKAGLGWRDDPRYREIRYEELVRAPEELLRDALCWLGLPWDPAVLRHYETHDERCSDVANPGVTRPVYQNTVGRWTRDLPAEAALEFHGDARALLIKLGYASDDSWGGAATSG